MDCKRSSPICFCRSRGASWGGKVVEGEVVVKGYCLFPTPFIKIHFPKNLEKVFWPSSTCFPDWLIPNGTPMDPAALVDYTRALSNLSCSTKKKKKIVSGRSNFWWEFIIFSTDQMKDVFDGNRRGLSDRARCPNCSCWKLFGCRLLDDRVDRYGSFLKNRFQQPEWPQTLIFIW